ncbi:MAG: hypothetical protein WAN65_32125, partial [Candidatus Sulfotelmatobacter sp.]
PQESAIYPDLGLFEKRTRVTMAASSRQQVQGQKALMWKITSRGFTLQEVLIMTATNIASALIANNKSQRTTTLRTEIQEATGDCYGKGD